MEVIGSLPNSVIQDLVTLSGFLLCTPSLGSGSQWLSIRIVAWQSELSLPYLRGFIISFRSEMKPSDLKVAPDELFPTKKSPGLPWVVFAQELDEGLAWVRPLVLECREFTGCFLKWLLFCISLWERMEDQTRIEWAHSLWSSLEDLWFGSREGCSLEPAMSSRTPPWISGMVTRRSLWHGFLSRAWWFNRLWKGS